MFKYIFDVIFDFILIEGNEITNFRTKISAERIVIQYLCDFLDIYKYYACTIEHFSEKEKYRYFNLNSNNQMRTYLLCLMQLQCICTDHERILCKRIIVVLPDIYNY